MNSTYISKQAATHLNTKRENKEEEKSLKKKHFPQRYVNMSRGLRIDVLVKFNY